MCELMKIKKSFFLFIFACVGLRLLVEGKGAVEWVEPGKILNKLLNNLELMIFSFHQLGRPTEHSAVKSDI